VLRIARRRTAVAVVAVAALVTSGLGAGWARANANEPPSYLGKPAASVAKALGCDGYVEQPRRPGSVDFHNQGSCRLDGFTVKITTFNSAGEQRAFAILTNTLIPQYTHRGGAYAEGNGWNVADDIDLSKTLATRASVQLRGSVREFSAGTPSVRS